MKPLHLRPAVIAAIVFVLAFDLAFLFQRLGGAYESEFGGHPDEAAHYVTGLMIRDYIAAGFPGSPMKFAEDYYAHYPKIGLGVWPPAFYVVQSAWTLAFGVSRTSVLLLMCALAATVSALIFRALREPCGTAAAIGGALLFVILPLVCEYDSMIMAEMLSAAFMFGAMFAFGRFLESEKTRDVLGFGVLAAAAILTKGTGLALMIAAPLAVLFAGKWKILARPALWGAGAITVVLAGPWTWKTKALGKGGWLQPSPSWDFSKEALPYYAGKLALALGFLAILFAIGLWVKLLRTREFSGRWCAAAALVISVLLFQSIAPVGLEARHMIAALPAALMFVVAGALAAASRFRRVEAGMPRSSAAVEILTVIAIVVLHFGSLPFANPPRKGFRGFRPIAEAIAPGSRSLISSDSRGEGMFISEVAMREERPGSTIERASKALASSSWSGGGYRAKFADDDQLFQHLRGAKLDFIVLDDALPGGKRLTHHDQLKRVLEAHADTFTLAGEFPIWRGGERQHAPIRLYRLRD